VPFGSFGSRTISITRSRNLGHRVLLASISVAAARHSVQKAASAAVGSEVTTHGFASLGGTSAAFGFLGALVVREVQCVAECITRPELEVAGHGSAHQFPRRILEYPLVERVTTVQHDSRQAATLVHVHHVVRTRSVPQLVEGSFRALRATELAALATPAAQSAPRQLRGSAPAGKPVLFQRRAPAASSRRMATQPRVRWQWRRRSGGFGRSDERLDSLRLDLIMKLTFIFSQATGRAREDTR
jgi:hypothetical protein